MASLETKLTQLRITTERTGEVISSSDEETITRHQSTLRAVINEVDNLRRDVEATKIEAKEEVTEWNAEINKRLADADGHVRTTKEWLGGNRKKQESIEHEDKLQFEMKLLETKLKLQTQHEKSSKESAWEGESPSGNQAKLPKLVITKFDGSYMDWPRFWGQFNENIEKSKAAPITKFTYLRELLDPKVRRTVESLPFTTEGYNRAMSLLQEKYGNATEIFKAYSREILDLPTITSANPRKIHDFSEKLMYSVQALQTMQKLDQINGAVSMTLDKLPTIRGDLVRTDPNWEKWDFAKLAEALRQWTRRNPIENKEREQEQCGGKRKEKDKLFQAHHRDSKPRGCTYCDDSNHKANECSKFTTVLDRKQIMVKRRLCFNCTSAHHRASECPSKTSCQHCNRRHHSSICESKEKSTKDAVVKDVAMTTNEKCEGVFPIVVVEVNGIKCRALIDSGAGSSYISSKLIQLLRIKPTDVQTKNIDMLMTSMTAKLEVYDVTLQSVDHQFSLPVRATKVNKTELLTVENPKYSELIEKHPHLKGVSVHDNDTKASLPIHMVLGNGEYARIKTKTTPRIGKPNTPVAELTRFGWFLMSPSKEFHNNTMLLTQTSQSDYELLCRLDVLGLEDKPEHDQSTVFDEFKEQLNRDPQGWYETDLPWKPNHAVLPTNKNGSLKRLQNLSRKLQRDGLTEPYDAIIQEQLQEGIVERAPPVSQPREFYIPHKSVVRKSAETTKMRIVYDASARETPNAPSLNDCLYTGPTLQNKLWDVLVQQRAYPVVVSGDIKKAFLQIRIREGERDALRFHWQPNANAKIDTYRFTRVLFGLAPSPFLLGGVLECHLDTWSKKYPEETERMRRSFYVDDLLIGGQNVEEAQRRKSIAIEVMSEARFELHKWHSNFPELEDRPSPEPSDEQSYAKQQLLVHPSESKLLGLKWDKSEDTIAVEFPTTSSTPTKREVLGKLAKIYDPLGLVSPTSLQGKLIYRDVCDSKVPWDAPVPQDLQLRWKRWEQSLPAEIIVPRALAPYRQPVDALELHAFGDASISGVGAAVYSVVRQQGRVTQTLVAAKARLAKRELTVPRLELVSAHMAANLVANVSNALKDLPKPTIYGWLDSTVALHWILGNGQYRQFVANRVKKIWSHPEIQWKHVPTKDNPADLASRGGQVTNSDRWWNGPKWLCNPEEWPDSPIIGKSQTSEAESKVVKEQLNLAQQQTEESNEDEFDDLLKRYDLPKVLRIQAWILRFTTNRERKGPLTSEDVDETRNWWIKRVQKQDSQKPHFEQTRQSLNLVLNSEEILKCQGRIQGQHPVYLPANSHFTRKLVQRVHINTLHGGVSLTMAAVREIYWIPTLRQMVKSIISKCWGCKRFRALPITKPPPGQLPTNRTEVGTAFEIIGTDFAGPIRYKQTNAREGKAYLLIFSCSLSRAVHLEVVPNMEATTFLQRFKRLIARRGRPRVVYSDNGASFIKAAKWLKRVRKDERVQGLLELHDITWRFNLSRAPWWGGQFERLIGVVKSALYKVIGGATLTLTELEEVMLDVEIQINRRPLSYVEDDVQLPTLTPTSFLFQRSNHLPEEESWRIKENDLRKRAKHLVNCKNSLWNRWKREYLTALRERHNLTHKTNKFQPKKGDVVIVKTGNKNRGTWPLAIVEQIYPGKDGIVRAVQLKTANGHLERAVQHLYPLELQCDVKENTTLDPAAPDFRPRPRRDAAAAANVRLNQIGEVEDSEW